MFKHPKILLLGLILLAACSSPVSAWTLDDTQQQAFDRCMAVSESSGTYGAHPTACAEVFTNSDPEKPFYYLSRKCPTAACTNYQLIDYHFFKNQDGLCEAPNSIDPVTGECLSPKQPEECQEAGNFYNPENSQCVASCPSGSSLGTYCLTQPDPACSPTSPDYQGTAGWGDDHRYVCSGETSCATGESYAFREMDDGSWSGVCVSDESNPPVCPGGFDSVLEIYDDGFACGNLNEDKEDPTRNDSSNGDSDGDGVADDTGMAGQLEDIKGLLKEGNNERSNIGNAIDKGFGDVKQGLGDVVDAIGNIPGGGGSSRSSQTEIVGEDGNAITWSGGAITMEVQDGLTELNAVQGEYESLIANIRSEMAASFGSFSGAGGLQDNNITLFGQTFNAGLSKFGADLSMIGSIILFAATFAALGIIMGARD